MSSKNSSAKRAQKKKEKTGRIAKMKEKAQFKSVKETQKRACLEVLAERGQHLEFLDLFDSYEELFHRVVKSHKESIGTLVDVREVPDEVLKRRDYHAMGIADWDLVFWDTGESDYGSSGQDKGRTTFGVLLAGRDAGRVKSMIFIPEIRTLRKNSKEVRYVGKIAALLHELGHAYDLHHGINFRFKEDRYDVVEAEVFAHLYALRELNRIQSTFVWDLYFDIMNGLKGGGVFAEEILRRVRREAPEKAFPDFMAIHQELFQTGLS